MACRPQSNPKSTSSDGVPPELEVLGFRGSPWSTGLTGRYHRSDRSVRREPVGEDRVDDPRVLALSSVLAQISVNTLFGDSAGDRLIWFLNRSNLVLKEDGRHHRPRRRQHLHIYRGTQRGGAPRVLGGQGALQSTILEGI